MAEHPRNWAELMTQFLDTPEWAAFKAEVSDPDERMRQLPRLVAEYEQRLLAARTPDELDQEFADKIRFLSGFLERSDVQDDPDKKLSVLLDMVDEAIDAERPEIAFPWLDQALEVARPLGDEELLYVYNKYGLAYEGLGDLEAAIRYQLQSLAAAEQYGRKDAIAVALANLGKLEGKNGNHQAAEDWLEKSNAVFDDIEDYRSIGTNWVNLGVTYNECDDVERARAMFEKALRVFTLSGDFDDAETVQEFIQMLDDPDNAAE